MKKNFVSQSLCPRCGHFVEGEKVSVKVDGCLLVSESCPQCGADMGGLVRVPAESAEKIRFAILRDELVVFNGKHNYALPADDVAPDYRGQDSGMTYREAHRGGLLRVVEDPEGKTFGMNGVVYCDPIP